MASKKFARYRCKLDGCEIMEKIAKKYYNQDWSHTDIVFLNKMKEFPAHSFVVNMNCDFLKRPNGKDFFRSEGIFPVTIDLRPRIDNCDLQSLLEYMYTGECRVSVDRLGEFQKLVKFFNVTELCHYDFQESLSSGTPVYRESTINPGNQNGNVASVEDAETQQPSSRVLHQKNGSESQEPQQSNLSSDQSESMSQTSDEIQNPETKENSVKKNKIPKLSHLNEKPDVNLTSIENAKKSLNDSTNSANQVSVCQDSCRESLCQDISSLFKNVFSTQSPESIADQPAEPTRASTNISQVESSLTVTESNTKQPDNSLDHSHIKESQIQVVSSTEKSLPSLSTSLSSSAKQPEVMAPAPNPSLPSTTLSLKRPISTNGSPKVPPIILKLKQNTVTIFHKPRAFSDSDEEADDYLRTHSRE